MLLDPSSACGLGAETFSAHVTLTSDFLFRGVSQTQENPAIQGGIDFQHKSGLFAAVWGSNVDFPNNAQRERRRDLEVDYFLGYGRDLSQAWSGYASLVRYDYPGSDPAFSYAYNELNLALQFRDRLAWSVAYSDDAFGHGQTAISYEVVARFPLPAAMDLSAGVGRSDVENLYGESYTYWNLGVSRSWHE